MSVVFNIAAISWTIDQTETLKVSEDYVLPGWTAGEIANARWHMQARDMTSPSTIILDFDSASDPPTLVAGAPVNGAGLDSTGAIIPGITVSLSFSQSNAALFNAPPGTYPCALKLITFTGDKTIIGQGSITIAQGPTQE